MTGNERASYFLFSSDDWSEGMPAFLEESKPVGKANNTIVVKELHNDDINQLPDI